MMISIMCLMLLAILDLSTTTNEFEDDVLAKHNKYRRKHGIPALKRGFLLDDIAYEKAADFCLEEYFTPYRRPESIYAGTTGTNRCLRVSEPLKCVDDWYNEIKYFDFKKPEYTLETSNFTQLIWRNTAVLGVAKVETPVGKWCVIAIYQPVGNVDDEFRRNTPNDTRTNDASKPIGLVVLSLSAFLLSAQLALNIPDKDINGEKSMNHIYL